MSEAMKSALKEPYRARNLRESPQCICRSSAQSISPSVILNDYDIKRATDLFVEYTIVLVDVSNVALFFVETLARELPFLVDAEHKESVITKVGDSKMAHSLLILPTTLSIASSDGLLSPYMRVFASRYKFSAASLCSWLTTATSDEDPAAGLKPTSELLP